MTIHRAYDPGLSSLDRLRMLIHGPYGGGKTHLQGDFLRWAQSQGKKARFLNIAGEDGTTSIAGMGLGGIVDTVESIKDFDQIIGEYAKEGLHALAMDSLPALYDLHLLDVVGSLRYPDAKIDGERARMQWGQLTMGLKRTSLALKTVAPFVLVVAAYDKSDDLTGGKGITPNLPGKLAWGCAGWFDMVGYLSAQATGPNNVVREITFAPDAGKLTRQRLTKSLTQSIRLPEGPGGWQKVYDAIAATFNNGKEVPK